MINEIKDFLGIRRKFTVSIYGVGYMSNVFHLKDVEIFNSIRYINKHGLNVIVVSKYLNRRTVNYPRIFAELNN